MADTIFTAGERVRLLRFYVNVWTWEGGCTYGHRSPAPYTAHPRKCDRPSYRIRVTIKAPERPRHRCAYGVFCPHAEDAS